MKQNELTPEKQVDHIVEATTEMLIQEAHTRAPLDAKSRRPQSATEMKVLFGDFVQTTALYAIKKIEMTLSPMSFIAEAQEKDKLTKENIALLRPVADINDSKFNVAYAQETKLKPNDYKTTARKAIALFLALFFLAEWYLGEQYFRNVGWSFTSSLTGGIVMGMLSAVGAHFLGEWTAAAKSTVIRKIRFYISLIPVVTGFVILGYIRWTQIPNIPIETSEFSSALPMLPVNAAQVWTQTIFSIGVYTFALFLCTRYAKSTTEIEQEHKYLQKWDEAEDYKIKRNKAQATIDKLTEDTITAKTTAIRIANKTEAAKRAVIAAAYLALAKYRELNVQYRPCGTCPDFFADDVYFDFSKFSDTSKTSSNE